MINKNDDFEDFEVKNLTHIAVLGIKVSQTKMFVCYKICDKWKKDAISNYRDNTSW